MIPLNNEQKQLIFDYCLGLTSQEQAAEAQTLISSNEQAAVIHNKLLKEYSIDHNIIWDFPYNIVYLSSATPLSLFSDRISYCSQQFKVSNLILELFQLEHEKLVVALEDEIGEAETTIQRLRHQLSANRPEGCHKRS